VVASTPPLKLGPVRPGVPLLAKYKDGKVLESHGRCRTSALYFATDCLQNPRHCETPVANIAAVIDYQIAFGHNLNVPAQLKQLESNILALPRQSTMDKSRGSGPSTRDSGAHSQANSQHTSPPPTTLNKSGILGTSLQQAAAPSR